MAERRQLPPQIRRVELARRVGSKPVVRYQLTVDTGMEAGKRKQLRRRYKTEKEARAALAEILGQVASGTYVQPSTLTVEDGLLRLAAFSAQDPTDDLRRIRVHPATRSQRAGPTRGPGPDPSASRRSHPEAA
jgi:hypothetical protein